MARPRKYGSPQVAYQAADEAAAVGDHAEAARARAAARRFEKNIAVPDPQTTLAPEQARQLGVKAYQQSEPVEVFERTPSFTARNAGHALAKIGDWFSEEATDGNLIGPANRIFEFVVDGHRFTVAIDPVENGQ